jgi:galactokinase
MVTAYAPGRVNLIGEHTDYSGGLVLPIAIDRGTTVTLQPGGTVVELVSDDEPEPAWVALDVADPAALHPVWARHVAGVVSVLRPAVGGVGRVSTTLPIGGGLSSSAALGVSLALAFGFDGPPLDLALACQQAEQRASGVHGGLMDQLVSAAGIEGHALMIDCSTNAITPVAVPRHVDIVVVHSGESRTLAGSAYMERRHELEAGHPGRVRHVETENERVVDFVDALGADDMARAGALMVASHVSLRDDFEVSTPTLDALVDRLCTMRGVYGARLPGAGVGGCLVAQPAPRT